MKKLLVLGMATAALAGGAHAQTLEERVEALEYQGYENIFRFKGSLEWQYDTTTVDYKDDNATVLAGDTDYTGEERTLQRHSLFAKIDMEAKTSDKLSFYGRLSMSKYTNRMNAFSHGSFGDIDGQLDEGQGLRDADVWMERAFVNYNFSKSLAFTFGRLPTSNGTPYHMTRDEAVGGAYPFLMYNAHFDGLALTYAVSDFKFKFIYTPFQFENNSSTSRSDGKEFDTPTDAWALIAEYDRNDLSWVRDMNITVGYLATEATLALAETDMNNSGTASNHTVKGLSDLSLDIKRAVLAMNFSGIMNSKFDLNLQYVAATIGTNGSYTTYNNPLAGGADTYSYFMTDDGAAETSNISILTTRYNINESNKIGLQLAQGSQYSFASDLVGKLPMAVVVPGSTTHLFYNHNFGGGLKVNLGYMEQKIEYKSSVGGIFGDREDADIQSKAVYTSFVANF